MKILYFFQFTILITAAFYTLPSFTFAEEKSIMQSDYSLQNVNSIPLPDQLEYAGEVVDLKRHDLRERYDREVLSFTYMHSTTFLLIKRANRYFPVIKPILKQNNIPDDFKYLAVVESYLNPRAVSPAKAAGIWQFVPETSKELGLEVNSEIDERYHLEKATVAACQYLQKSYELYGDWITAASSYNAGRRRISNSLEEQKSDNFLGLYLNDETSRYVFRLLAIKQVMGNPSLYGFHLNKEDFYHTVRTKEVEVSGPVESWPDWAIANGTDYVQLKYFNPWILGLKLTNKDKKTYKIKIPYKEDLDYNILKVKIHDNAWIN